MFNETSYPNGLGDAATIQRKLDKGKAVNPKKLARFGFPGGDPIVPILQPGLPPPPPMTTLPLGPAAPATGQGEGTMVGADPEAGGGFDLSSITDSVGGIFNMLPWWAWAAGAYFVFFRKKR